MINELSINANWRFTPIIPGDKRPLLEEWQKQPLTLDTIPNVPQECNIGLLLGESSGGVVALDFDGEEAWEYWNSVFSFAPPKTVCWTSGKDMRMQMLYTVPRDIWPFIKKKVVSKLEFRWSGGQSVMPPSRLDDGREYTWINAPSTTPVAELHVDILQHWISLCAAPKSNEVTPQTTDGLNNYILQRLAQMGCVSRKGGETINVWHRHEATKGGWFIYVNNPLWVCHNSHKSMRVDSWLKEYWLQTTDIISDYKAEIMAQIQELKDAEKSKK